MTRKQRRAFMTYRALGGRLGLQDWKESERHRMAQAQAADAIVLPRSFWWAVGICGLSVGVAIGIVGRAVGWW